jgi:hypothetical protein
MNSPSSVGAHSTASAARLLLAVARDSIRSGIEFGRPARPDPQDYPVGLRAPRASFVSLHLEGELRGCIGGLEPLRPLVSDVAEHAFAAAFRDPRFPPICASELEKVEVHVSVLSPLEPLRASSHADLLRQLRPGIDGLVFEAAGRRATFLPEVWKQLPDPEQFVLHLKRKAGVSPDYWSDSVRLQRYMVESSFSD